MTLLRDSIDQDSSVRFNFQLAELLEHAITSGRLDRGLQLPSEDGMNATKTRANGEDGRERRGRPSE